ncbi:MAG: hypothetical protein LBJ83_03205 [Oscillospiraceae bacterium]|nr:hypothetical protein [Oscillospiraceae bacterium]
MKNLFKFLWFTLFLGTISFIVYKLFTLGPCCEERYIYMNEDDINE